MVDEMERNFNASYIGPRDDILSLIPRKVQRILDIGCSTGALGKKLKQKNDVEICRDRTQ